MRVLLGHQGGYIVCELGYHACSEFASGLTFSVCLCGDMCGIHKLVKC